ESTNPATDHLVVQSFDMHATTILSLGCGDGPLSSLDDCVVQINHPQKHWASEVYGESSRALEIVNDISEDWQRLIGSSSFLLTGMTGGTAWAFDRVGAAAAGVLAYGNVGKGLVDLMQGVTGGVSDI